MQPIDYSHIRTLTARLSILLNHEQLPQLRGAIALDADWENDVFHNHAPSLIAPASPEAVAYDRLGQPALTSQKATLKEAYMHRYPRIHYRIQQGKAALWGVNEGAFALRKWLLKGTDSLRIGDTHVPLRIDHLQERAYKLDLMADLRPYELSHYLPLNRKNFQAWQAEGGLIGQLHIVQRALAGHLLGFCSAMGYYIPGGSRALEVKLIQVDPQRPVKLHGIIRPAFRVRYQTNLSLPAGIALGRGVAHGYGIQRSL